jgi:putative transposase
MPRPLSNDLRERIVRAVEGGLSRNAAAKKYEVSISAVVKLMQRWAATQECKPRPVGGYRGHKLSPHEDVILEIVKSRPDATLEEIRALLAARKIKASRMGIFRFLDHLGQSYKKNSARQRARQARRQGGAAGMAGKSGNP